MLNVNPISQEEVDSWKIAQSGLPTRVVNSARTAGIRTIGELRTWKDADLLKIRSLGRISLSHIHAFLKTSSDVVAGTKEISELKEVFDMFLDRDEYIVITARYGLLSENLNMSRKQMTLQAIGNQEHKTRERIRQIEENAKKRLQSKLGMVCLQPFYDYCHDLLCQRGKTADAYRLAPITNHLLFSNCNPGGVLHLLSDLAPKKITFMNGFFSILPLTLLKTTEKELIVFLRTQHGPLNLMSITAGLPPMAGFGSAEALECSARTILEHADSVAVTRDNRYFLYSQGMSRFLSEVMKTLPLPAHFRAITAAVNEQLKPECRKGAGFVLEALNAHPDCRRLERGIYDLVAPR